MKTIIYHKTRLRLHQVSPNHPLPVVSVSAIETADTTPIDDIKTSSISR